MNRGAWCEMEEIEKLITSVIRRQGNKAYLDGLTKRIQNISRSYLLSEATTEGQALLTKEWEEDDG